MTCVQRPGRAAAVLCALLLVGSLTALGLFAATPTAPLAAGARTARTAPPEKLRTAVAAGQLLFVGASYTVGLGATTPSAGYATVTAHRMDRRFAVAAVAGTGFVCTGPHDQGTYAQRIDRLPRTLDPKIVLIQGGRNDAGFPAGRVHTAARSTIDLARHRFTHARVVVMGPIPASFPVSPRLLQVRGVVRQAAQEAGAGFIDPIAEHWITAQNARGYTGRVAFHPNDAGYAHIAGRLVADLPTALDRSGPPLSTEQGGHTGLPAAPLVPVGADLPEGAEVVAAPTAAVATGTA